MVRLQILFESSLPPLKSLSPCLPALNSPIKSSNLYLEASTDRLFLIQTLEKDPSMITALLQYHVLNGSVPSSAFTTTSQFIPTLLTNTSFTNVTGGQVVMGLLSGKTVEVFSGLKEKSIVTTADIMFSGGVVHVIDTVLTVPLSASASAIDSQLTALAGALKQTNLITTVNSLKDVTIFAPSNKAFQNIGSAAGSLTNSQLSSILEYHVIAGTVGYSSLLMSGLANETLPTVLSGEGVAIESVDKKVFINSAQVVITDIIVANGVMHVIDK
jgi:transforming growth factor-beta-induced protein